MRVVGGIAGLRLPPAGHDSRERSEITSNSDSDLLVLSGLSRLSPRVARCRQRCSDQQRPRRVVVSSCRRVVVSSLLLAARPAVIVITKAA